MYENEDLIKWKRECSELLSSDGNDSYLKDAVCSKEDVCLSKDGTIDLNNDQSKQVTDKVVCGLDIGRSPSTPKEMHSMPSVKLENRSRQLIFEMYFSDVELRSELIKECILRCRKNPTEIINYHGVIETISPPQLETRWCKNPKEMTNALAEGFINYSKEDLKCCQLLKKDQ